MYLTNRFGTFKYVYDVENTTYQLFKHFDFDFLNLQGIRSQNGSFQVTNSAVLLQICAEI